MPRELRAKPIHIEAPPEAVWSVLTDFQSFPRWNPFIRYASGELVVGKRIQIHLRIYRRMLSRLRPQVIMVSPPNELRWLAKNGPQGVFDVERFFMIERSGAGGSTFIHGEDCSGALAPILLRLGLESRILKGYERLSSALKKRVERLLAEGSPEGATGNPGSTSQTS